ncbi:hypothetical protein BC835DRAFT_1531119, partial [Cytidiella melzeri]
MPPKSLVVQLLETSNQSLRVPPPLRVARTSQANEVPLQIPTSTQAVPAGSNPFQGQTHTSEPEDRNQSQRTEEGSILHAFVCRGENAVGDILDRVIESFDNIAMAAPSWDPSGAFFAELPVDHFEAYFRKWDPASPSLLIASTQAHRHIEASTFIQGTVSDMASSVSQIRSDMAKLRSERRLRFQQEHMEVDDEALPSYARPTTASAAKGPGPKAKKTLDSICVAPGRASRREHGGAGGAASEAEEIMTPGARRSYADAAKKKGKDKAPAKSPFEAKKLRTADNWFKSLSVEMINNFALGLRVLGPTAVDFSIDQILATGQRMGSFGFPMRTGCEYPGSTRQGKGKIVVPGTHPANDTKPDAEQISWQLAEHEQKGGATTTPQPKLNPVIRVKWDRKPELTAR